MPIRVRGFPIGDRSRLRSGSDGLWFVRPGGNNGNDGGLNTDSRAFATPQGAINYVQRKVDFNGNGGLVQIADGTYINGGDTRVAGRFVGYGSTAPLTIQGNLLDNTKVVLKPVNRFVLTMSEASLRLDGVTITNTVGGDGINLDNESILQLGNIRFEDIVNQMMFAGFGSQLYTLAGSTITTAGSAQNWVHHTHKAVVSFEDSFLVFAPNPASGLNPQFSIYKVGGNDSSFSVNRTEISGQHAGRVLEHFGGLLKHDTNLGSIFSTFYFVGQPADQFDTASQWWPEPAYNTSYYGALGDNRNNGYSPTSKFLNYANCVDYFSRRPKDQTNGLIPIIQAADDTYNGGTILGDIVGVPVAIYQGNVTTPSNCFINATGSNAIQIEGTITKWIIQGFKLASSGSSGISLRRGSSMAFGNIEFGDCHDGFITMGEGAYIEDLAPWAWSGSTPNMVNAASNAVVLLKQPVTITNSPVISGETVRAQGGAVVRIDSVFTVASGSPVTGKRYTAITGGGIIRGADTLPGTLPGTVDAASWTDMAIAYNRTRQAYHMNGLVSVSGTTSKTTLVTVTGLGLGGLGINGYIDVMMAVSLTNNANNKTIFVEIGGVNYAPKVYTVGGGDVIHVRIWNRASQAVQRGGTVNGVSIQASTADFSLAQNLVISAQLAVGTDLAAVNVMTVDINPGD